MDYLYFDDFVGQAGQFTISAPVAVNEAAIIEFARQFDPQPMHVDPEAAQSITGGLIASGWHTAALTMRLMLDSRTTPLAPGTLGLGFESLKWLKPVRPGDVLRVHVELLEATPSASKPDRGIITNRMTTLNQHDEPVQVMISKAIVPRRPPA